MTRLTHMTLSEARDGLARRDFTAVELTEQHIAAIESEAGRPLNAFACQTADKAVLMAKASDQRRRRGVVGALDGLPIAIKDNFAVEDVLMTSGSHILDGFVPPYESTVTEKLWAAGAVCLGKLNMDEFAMGSSTVTSYNGPVVSPWKRHGDSALLVPGGSSGGSATAVSARLALAATGTDTGGSIRQPAGLCGIVGVKPTYGRCSRFGIVSYASSLDQAGPMTRTVRDAAIMLEVMSGHDDKDSTSAPLAVPDFQAALTGDVRGLRVGVPREYRADGMPSEIDELWRQGAAWLEAAGAKVVEISLPMTKFALATYYIIAPAEASANLARYDGVRFGLRVPGNTLDEMYENTRAEGFGKEVQRRLLMGTYVLSDGYYDAYYLKAQRVRALIAADFARAFAEVDVILTPTSPSPAFAIGEKMDDPLTMYLDDVFTVPINLAGLPAISVPAGLSHDGLPLGLQVIARSFDEETMFRVAGALEEAAAFKAVPATVKLEGTES